MILFWLNRNTINIAVVSKKTIFTWKVYFTLVFFRLLDFWEMINKKVCWLQSNLRTLIKGGALLTVGYTIFGNKSYSYKMYS